MPVGDCSWCGVRTVGFSEGRQRGFLSTVVGMFSAVLLASAPGRLLGTGAWRQQRDVRTVAAFPQCAHTLFYSFFCDFGTIVIVGALMICFKVGKV